MSQTSDHRLRKLLWLHHSWCSPRMLYGDDGEMQCSACLIDFKRNTLDDLESHAQAIGITRLIDADPVQKTLAERCEECPKHSMYFRSEDAVTYCKRCGLTESQITEVGR